MGSPAVTSAAQLSRAPLILPRVSVDTPRSPVGSSVNETLSITTKRSSWFPGSMRKLTIRFSTPPHWRPASDMPASVHRACRRSTRYVAQPRWMGTVPPSPQVSSAHL